MQLDAHTTTQFQQKILDWYAVKKRDFPWRKTRDPYAILVSEVMSQQTQINRVVAKFEAWMKRFPTIDHLAKASVAEVLSYWSGLGYNRRALHLKKTAEIIHNNFGGKFPTKEAELLKLPGIGEYTAHALLCFAFDQQIAVVDTNVRKVIVTQFGFDGDIKALHHIAEQLLPKGRAYEWNQALMDYAATMLKKEKISVPKQSKFVGSHRYYRGQILKYLLKNKKEVIHKLGSAIKKDYTEKEKLWLETLIQELQAEGFIDRKKNVVCLVS